MSKACIHSAESDGLVPCFFFTSHVFNVAFPQVMKKVMPSAEMEINIDTTVLFQIFSFSYSVKSSKSNLLLSKVIEVKSLNQ